MADKITDSLENKLWGVLFKKRREQDVSRGRWEDYDHSDQEMDMYDQSCDNCTNCHCPMMLPETAEEYYEEYGTLEGFDVDEAEDKAEEVLQRRKEDAINRDGDPVWCIYWKGRGDRW